MARRTTSPADETVATLGDPPPNFMAESATAPEPLPEGTAHPSVSKPASKTALTLLLGSVLGVAIAALGYGAAVKFPLEQATTASAVDAVAYNELAAKLDAIDLGALESRIAALESLTDPLAAELATETAARIDALELKLSKQIVNGNLQAELEDIRQKLAQSDPTPAIKSAIEAQMGAVQKTAQTMAAEVAKAAEEAGHMAAMTLLQAALDTGAPYASVAQQIDLPPALATHAQTGIPSLTALREGFPDAARLGLDAALKENMGQTWSERAANFLRSQTGARSLTPREGNDPDAILSRIDAGLMSADLQLVLAEIATLPADAQTAMQSWSDDVKLRAEALAAFSGLSSEGN
jgi:hypothetical protein